MRHLYLNFKSFIKYFINEEIDEAGYAGGPSSVYGAASFRGGPYGFGGQQQLAKGLSEPVKKLKQNRDREAKYNIEDQVRINRGYPAAQSVSGYPGGESRSGPRSGARIPNSINQIAIPAGQLDALNIDDPKKQYWGFSNSDNEEIRGEEDAEQEYWDWVEYDSLEDLFTADEALDEVSYAVGPARGVASDSNYRDLPGYPRHNSIEKPIDLVPDVENDEDGDGEEDVYLSDEEYVEDVLSKNGMGIKPGDSKRLFYGNIAENVDKIKSIIDNMKQVSAEEGIQDLKLTAGFNTAGLLLPRNAKKMNWFFGNIDISKLHTLGIDSKKVSSYTSELKDSLLSKEIDPIFVEVFIEWDDYNMVEKTKFEIIDGNHRVATAKKLGIDHLPGYIIVPKHIDLVESYVSPSYGPEPNKGIERYKQGKWIRDHEPDATKKLIKHVDYTGGHTGMSPAEESPGAQQYGVVGFPKKFVPDDWEQRSPKTKADDDDRTMNENETIKSIIEKLVKEELQEAYTGINGDENDPPKGGSAAFEKNRKKIIDYDKKNRPKGIPKKKKRKKD